MTGLFSEEGFPHKGWDDFGFEELEKGNYEICEACGSQEIRFVHILKHPDYPKEIRVGCVCAENLTGNYSLREKEKNAERKKNFIKSPKWKRDCNGNLKRKFEGYTIMILKKSGLYQVIAHKIPHYQNEEIRGRKCFTNEIDAKKAAFDGILILMNL